MEYENENENKVGAGILTLCILHFIGSVLGIFSVLFSAAVITPELASQSGISADSITASIIPTIIISILMVVACIMLLLKQKIGVFLYFFVVLANVIVTIALSGFSPISLILALILPVLMTIFISKKKEVYGFGTK